MYNYFKLFLFLASATFSSGSITMTVEFGRAFTAGGLSQVAAGTIGVLVADTGGGLPSNTDLVGSVLSNNSVLGASGARVLRTIQATDISGSGDFGFQDTFTITDFTGLTPGSGTGNGGSNLAIYWFPGLTADGSIVADGQSYGSFRSDTIDSGSGANISFNIPSDPGSYTLAAFDTELGGGYSSSLFQANSVAGVPEPSRMVLALLGLAGLMLRRRR